MNRERVMSAGANQFIFRRKGLTTQKGFAAQLIACLSSTFMETLSAQFSTYTDQHFHNVKCGQHIKVERQKKQFTTSPHGLPTGLLNTKRFLAGFLSEAEFGFGNNS